MKTIRDNKGALTFVEFKDIPFTPKRMFYIKDVPTGTIRGNHAHYKDEQFLICVKGLIRVEINTGKTKIFKTLYPGESIYVKKLQWDTQEYLEIDSILLVLCKENYSKEDYITDFILFKELTK